MSGYKENRPKDIIEEIRRAGELIYNLDIKRQHNQKALIRKYRTNTILVLLPKQIEVYKAMNL